MIPTLVEILAACCERAGRDDAGALPPGFEQVASFRAPCVGLRPAARARHGDLRDLPCGGMLRSEELAVVVLSGTLSLREWILESTEKRVVYDARDPLKGKVHLGAMLEFRLLAHQIRAAVREHAPERLCVTGHGLGGTLALLAAADLAPRGPEVCTFGAPRVGDARFAAHYDELVPSTFRVVNELDPAPALPVSARHETYAHVGRELAFRKQTGDPMRNHAIETYLDALREGQLA